MANIPTDYTFTDKDLREFSGVVLMPVDLRIEFLLRYERQRGREALVNLFAQFIGMANSVTENNRTFAVDFLITEAKMFHHEAEKLNMGTIFGALMGAKLANGVNQAKTCAGCAYRLGTPANHSSVTTIDADYCQQNGDDFMCHEELDARGEPMRPCRGHAQAVKGKK